MNGNGIIDLFRGREKKRFYQIIQLIDTKNYDALLNADSDEHFGLSNSKLIQKIIERMEQEVLNNPELLVIMNQKYYHRVYYFNEQAIKQNPKIIESLINANIYYIDGYILQALENGYMPSNEYIDEHIRVFALTDIMKALIAKGYRPTKEQMEVEPIVSLFKDEELLEKALDWGYIPTVEFLKKTNALRNTKFTERILNTIEINEELLKTPIFVGNPLAQQIVLDKKKEIILSLSYNDCAYSEFWIEAIKKGYIPNEILQEYSITGNYVLFSKIIRQRPELIKYCQIIEKDKKSQIDELAICMGYVPTIQEVQESKYIKKSARLMHALIINRPEAIKYIETRPLDGGYTLEISDIEFQDLGRLAIESGYIPTMEDIEKNPRLADSYDIMRILIQNEPNAIKKIRDQTPNKEELLKVAIQHGFNEQINSYYWGKEGTFSSGGVKENALLATETGIMYQVAHGRRLYQEIRYAENYSPTLYHFLLEHGFQLDEIIHLFNANEETMREIITEHPEYITKVSPHMEREAIDNLANLAISLGYEPQFEDEIFGYGQEIALMMVKKYPSYLEKVQLMDNSGFFMTKPFPLYQEVCRTAVERGFVPPVEKMGPGYGDTTIVYNYSYDIMVKAIPTNPKLIEYCDIADKGKYDELCRLAIEHGYIPDNEYALTHWATKLCTNVDMMAIYLENHPDFILNVEVENSDEMLRLIDIVLAKGYRIQSLSVKELVKIFLNVEEEKWSTYLDQYTIERLKKAKELAKNNNEISKTINPAFLSDDITSNLTKDQVEILSCYPKLQEKIVKVAKDKQKIKYIFELANKYKNNLEWIPIIEKALDNIESTEFSNLLSSIQNKELEPNEKDNLLILLMTNNHLDISTYEELKNIHQIREEYLQRLVNRNTLGSLRTAYFEKVYGIDLSTAINIVNLYGEMLNSDRLDTLDDHDKRTISILANMKKILNLNNIEVLRYYVDHINPEFVITPDVMITYEARLKYLIIKEFNKSFVKPNEEDRVETNTTGEENYSIYLAAGKDGKKKCRMMITSIGAYTCMEEPDDYYASWNVDKIASHGCCCSYVGEKNLGTARIKYCCLGFTDYEPGSLQLLAPYDLSSHSTEDSYEIKAYFPSQFMLPEDILDHTRHTHNEAAWERRNIHGDSTFKKQPSYIVYFVDNFDDRLTDPEAMRQWESVKKAAANFGTDGKPLPIMVVEREKIAKAQKEVIEEKLEELRQTKNPKLIKEIVSDYESNYAGNREYHVNIMTKYFPKHEQLSDSVVGKILEMIKEMHAEDPKQAMECLEALEKAVKSENAKYHNMHQALSETIPSFNIEEALMRISQMKVSLKTEVKHMLSTIEQTKDNTIQYEKVDSPTLSEEMREKQLSTEEVIKKLKENGILPVLEKTEKEIEEEGINAGLKVHGQRHIKNVVLYSLLVGKEVLEDEHDLELITIAAKYHDVGRKTEGHEEHALPSAEIAEERLKGKLKDEDIAIIRTVIEFHEVPRNHPDEEEIFKKIAKKNNIPFEELSRVKRLAEVLKDADALDRTRFINRARLDARYLEYDASKKLVKFASSLQETYAIEDLKAFQEEKAIKSLLKYYSPQEILRTIRHSIKGAAKEEEARTFIRSWAETIKSQELNDMFEERKPEEEQTNYGK